MTVKVMLHKNYTKIEKFKTPQILTKLSGMIEYHLLSLQKKFQPKTRNISGDIGLGKISECFVKVVRDSTRIFQIVKVMSMGI